MTDVRLTALNPENSQVYPVACNASGELLVSTGGSGPDLDIQGNLSVAGTASIVGAVTSGEYFSLEPSGTSSLAKLSYVSFYLIDSAGAKTAEITNNGNATFTRVLQFPLAEAYGPGPDGDTDRWRAFDASGDASTGNITSKINANGNAEFYGEVKCGAASSGGSEVNYGVIATANKENVGNTAAVLARNYNSNGRNFAGVDATGTTTCSILSNGNATFSGNVSAANINNFRSRLLEAAQASGSHEDLKNAIVTALAEL